MRDLWQIFSRLEWSNLGYMPPWQNFNPVANARNNKICSNAWRWLAEETTIEKIMFLYLTAAVLHET